MKKRKKSPCIDICEFSGPKGWCLGCGRTREELKKWKTLKPYAKAVIEKDLGRRKAKIAATNKDK